LNCTSGDAIAIFTVVENTAQAPGLDTTLFYGAFIASPIGIALEDLEGRPLFVNPALCSMLGFSEDEMRRKHCVDFSPPEDAEKDSTLFEQLRAGTIDHYHLDKRFLRRDGSLIWGRLSISLLNRLSSPLVIAMVEDITAKKIAEETLDLGTKHVAAVCRCSRDFRYLWVNQGCAHLLQRPLDEIVGRPIVDVLGEKTFEDLRHYFDRVLTGEQVQYEVEVSYRGVGPRWISATYSPTFDVNGVVDGWVAVVVDVTERKRAEEARSRHAAIVEHSDDAIISQSLEGIILSWNQGAQHLFGYTESEALGRPIAIIIPEELRDEEKEILQRVVNGKPVEHYETRRVSKNGKIIHVSITLSPIKDAEGSIIGASKIARDITERKLAEEALATVSQRLIEAQEQERSRLARELHDNINQKIAMLAINLEALKDCLPSSAVELEGQIEEAHEQAVAVGSDIQALSHRLHSPKLGLLGLAATAASFCKEFSGQQKVEIDFQSQNVPKGLPQDIALCLFRILQEALQNAAKHSGSRKFQVALRGETNEIELTVHDSGVGFEPQEAIKGRGLGLTSMKERLNTVDGQLSIESKPEHGTTIRARVPLPLEMSSAKAS
jgi:PAS domain S-box-containing protein